MTGCQNYSVKLRIYTLRRKKQKLLKNLLKFQKQVQILLMLEYIEVSLVLNNKGNLSLDVNNISYAQFDFEEVLKQDKQNLKALKGLTITQKMQCNYELGLKYALKVIMHEPQSPLGNFNAADCLKFLGQYNEKTLQYINQAIDQEKRRYEQRIQIYFRNKGMVIFYKGEILFGLNRVNEAREFVLKALEINQNYELAIKTLKRFDEILQRRANT
ncbi:unnamed protein product [Paramecium primaurelia]|uniref:Tetratricopeptide repeat protein n=1 Tax=Paramecium primaurelia TaxID=5886 RepID=A0A8S1P301_PARPR|nr:unnamed protein product [Paramecium primaurelia]